MTERPLRRKKGEIVTYERYNVASKRDLDVARERMERNAMERLYSTSNSTSNSNPPARHGKV